MSCNIQSLFNNGRCMATLMPGQLAVVQTQLWCDIGTSIAPGEPGSVWWNPDTNQPWFNPDAGGVWNNPDV